MAIQKSEAIVIKVFPFRSTSLIVTFFTKQFGKVRGLVKGVRQEGERGGAVYELFTNVEIVFYEKTRSDLHLISEAFILEPYNALHARLESISYASYFAELVDEVSEVQDPHEEIFTLLDFAYCYLAVVPGNRLARLFEIKLLSEVGWLPDFEECLNCKKTHLERGFFSPRQGSMICLDCAPQFPDARPLNSEPLSVMRYYIHHDLDACLKLGMTKQTETELEAFMNRFLSERLHRPLKSGVFLSKIKQAFSNA